MSVCMREGLFEMGTAGLHMSGIRLQTSPCLKVLHLTFPDML